MNSGSGETVYDFSVIEELSAYLDGELDQVAMQKVELRLGADPKYLAEMQSLQKTWDILDELPLAAPSASFTKTTMEIVVSEAVKESKKGQKRNRVLLVRIATVAATAVVLFGVSFLLIRLKQAETDRFLIENLSAIENYERFQVVENDIEFLEQLNQFGLFSDRSLLDDDGELREELLQPKMSHQIPDSSEAKRLYIESLDVEQKTKLRRKLDDFAKLPTGQVDQILAFDRRLGAHQSVDELMVVMHEYYDWLRSLDDGERSRLLDLEKPERIHSIAQFRAKQAREAFGRTGATQLPSSDAEVVFDWFNEQIKAKEQKIRANFPRAIMRFGRDNNIRTISTRRLVWIAQRGPLDQLVKHLVRVDREFVEDIVFEDLEVLSLLLTPEARAILGEQSLEEQRELVLEWVVSASQSRSDVSQATLRRFAKTLPIEEQDQLDKLSTENYFSELKSKYRDRQERLNRKQDDDSEIWDSIFEFENPRN